MPATIEPDAKLAVKGASSPPPLAGEDDAPTGRREAPPDDRLHASGGGRSAAPSKPAPAPPSPASGGGRQAAVPGSLTPQALAAARLDIAHQPKIRPLEIRNRARRSTRLNAWIERARDLGFVAIDTETIEPRSDAGRAVRLFAGAGAERGLLRAAVAPPGRRRQWRVVPGRDRARSDCRSAPRSTPSSRSWKTPACSRSART